MRSIFPVAASMLLATIGCGGTTSAGDASDSSESIGEATSAIQGGYSDDADQAVVGLAITDADGYLSKTCSGVLISPTLVLTAQHCIAETTQFVSCDGSTFGPPVDPAQIYVTTAGSMWASATLWHPVNEVDVPPGGDGVCGRDLALLVLAVPLDAEARPLTPRLDPEVAPAEGYSAIGYGASDGDGDDAGIRRRRDDLEVTCVGSDCATSQVDAREWRGLHGICNGDSGGPAIDADGAVVGITSRGPVGCDDPIYGGLAAHRDWMVSTAVHAASVGKYDRPKWAGGSTDNPATAESEEQTAATAAGWSSCATSSRPSNGGSATALGLVVVAGWLAARRKRA